MSRVWVNITDTDGTLLERFQVEGGNVREDRAKEAHAVKIAAQIQEHVGNRFNIVEE
jgi:hypothetical protein